MKLGVNIDHIATIRQARMGIEPDPIYAAAIAELAGADGITIHLRQDRRHIQERDLEILRRVVQSKLNLEMAMSQEMIEIALKYKPDVCTLVAETAAEITTNGGLDVILNETKVMETARQLNNAGIEVSIFVDPDIPQLTTCHKLGIKVIELNTGKYAESWNTPTFSQELERIQNAVTYAHTLHFKILAGHGLNYRNVVPIAAIAEIEELNIGHSIIANAAFIGLEKAVINMKELLNK